MTGTARKTALLIHVAASLGWLGAVGTFIAVAVVAVTSTDPLVARSAVLMMEPIGWLAIVPLTVASLITGLIQSFVTAWGLLNHYWVIVKLVINIASLAILLEYTRTLAALSDAATNPDFTVASLGQMRYSPLIHSTLALMALVIAASLAVYKPRGMTKRGRRKSQVRSQANGRPSRSIPSTESVRR